MHFMITLTQMTIFRVCVIFLVSLYGCKLFSSQHLVEDVSTGLSVQPGFEVDLVYMVDNSIYGSWISMAFDKDGRLVVSDQGKAGTFLLDLPGIGKCLLRKTSQSCH